MRANEITFFRLIAVQIVPGVSFYGTIEIEVNLLDPGGWWVRSVMAYSNGCNRELDQQWARLVRAAVDRDTTICDMITERCVRMVSEIKARGEA